MFDFKAEFGEYAEEVEGIFLPKDNPSTYEDYGNYKVLNIRNISVSEKSLHFQSQTFYFKGKNIFKFNHENENFDEILGGYLELNQILETSYHANQQVLYAYSDEIDKLESALFNRDIPGYFMDFWFDLKKDLAKIENYFYRSSSVYREFYKRNEKNFGEYVDEFKDVEDIINFQNAFLNSLKSKMDSLHHYYNSIKADRLNKTLLALTLLSGIFLPLNLIVGFFGMNTNGLFLKDNEQGTLVVVYILVGIFLVFTLALPLIRLLDRLVFTRFLGRYDFYQNISKKITKIEEHINV